MRIRIGPSRCTGHGRCYSLVPEIFDADDEGHGVVVVDDVPRVLEQAALRAVHECPEAAVRDDERGS
jgi:ferredoxin